MTDTTNLLAITMAATSAFAASRQNRAIESSISAQRSSSTAAMGQLSEQAAAEKLKRQREAAQVRGRLRVSAAQSGVGFGGTFAALERQADIDEQLNTLIIDKNLKAGLARVRADFTSSANQLSSGFESPFSAAIMGGLGGFETGLRIGDAQAEMAMRKVSNVATVRPGFFPPRIGP